MAKSPKPALVPALAQVAAPIIKPGDLHNLVVAARQALPALDDVALGHVTDSIRRVSAVLASLQQAEAAKLGAPATKG